MIQWQDVNSVVVYRVMCLRPFSVTPPVLNLLPLSPPPLSPPPPLFPKRYRSCNSCAFTDTPTGAYQIVRGSVIYERTVAKVDAAKHELTLVEPMVQVRATRSGYSKLKQ